MKTEYPTVRGSIPGGAKLEENVYVEMRDKIKIAVDIFRPEKEGSYPALISIAPYLKEIQQQPPFLSHSIEAGNTGFFVPRGYVHVIVQMRGTGFSQGQYNILDLKQQQDGYDMIEWVAKQPWCDGNVAMLGDSYYSMIQYFIAALQPPHLKCISIFDGFVDLYRDFSYRGGIFNAGFLGMWGPDTILQCAWPGPIEGKQPPTNMFYDFAINPDDGEYWWERGAWTKIDKIKVPVLSMMPIHGYVHSRGQLDGYSRINSPKKLVLLPDAGLHAHELFLTSEPVNQQILKWFDYWLKGVNTGIMEEPEVTIYDQSLQTYRYENEYPLARTKWTKYFFHSNPNGESSESPYGLISIDPPEQEKPDSYDLKEAMIQENAGIPPLAYATPSLESNLQVWGPLSLTLYGSSTTLDTAWFIKLGDLKPDGNFQLLSQGVLKASYREVDEEKSKPGQPFHPFQNAVRPEPNKIYEYQIEMAPIFYTFKPGHKICVQIASSSMAYQEHIRTLGISELMLPLPARNTIYHDSANPSHLLLPVIPDASIIKPVEPPVSEIKWPF